MLSILAHVGTSVPVLIIAGASIGTLAVLVYIAIFGHGHDGGPMPCYRCGGKEVEPPPLADSTDDIPATLTAVRWALEQARQDAAVESVRHAIVASIESIDSVIATLESARNGRR